MVTFNVRLNQAYRLSRSSKKQVIHEHLDKLEVEEMELANLEKEMKVANQEDLIGLLGRYEKQEEVVRNLTKEAVGRSSTEDLYLAVI